MRPVEPVVRPHGAHPRPPHAPGAFASTARPEHIRVHHTTQAHPRPPHGAARQRAPCPSTSSRARFTSAAIRSSSASIESNFSWPRR